jgi:hypothetical protein
VGWRSDGEVGGGGSEGEGFQGREKLAECTREIPLLQKPDYTVIGFNENDYCSVPIHGVADLGRGFIVDLQGPLVDLRYRGSVLGPGGNWYWLLGYGVPKLEMGPPGK